MIKEDKLDKFVESCLSKYPDLTSTDIKQLIENFFEYYPHLGLDDIEVVYQDVISHGEYTQIWFVAEKDELL